MKVALCVTPGDWPVDDDVAANTREAAAALVDAGAIVEEIEMGPNWGPANISRLTLIHFGAIFGAWIATELEHRELMTPYAIDIAERSLKAIGETSFYEGLVGEGQLHFELGDIHEQYELLVFPTSASRGLVAGDDYVGHGLEIGGEMQSWYLAACMTPPFNICSRSPVLAAPERLRRQRRADRRAARRPAVRRPHRLPRRRRAGADEAVGRRRPMVGGERVSDLAYLSATEALARFRDRSLSPVELTQALIDRAAEVEPTVNALCVTFFEAALEQARAAEDRYMGRGEPPRALEGICVGIKDEVPIAGQPCSMGSLLQRDEIADHDRPDGRADPRRRWHRPRPHDDARVLHRRLHALAAVGCHAQPVEPGVRRRRLVGRHRRVARVGHVHARHRLRHRRLDPHAGRLERRGRVQGAVRPRAADAAVQHGRLLPQRPPRAHASPTARCSRT